MIDLGDPWPNLSVTTKNAAGVPENATAVVLTIALPDGTTVTPAVTAAGSGVYTASYTPTLPGRYTARWVATGVNASAYTDQIDVDEGAPSGLVSLAEVRAHLEFRNPDTANAKDEELRRFIDAATDFIENDPEDGVGTVARRPIVENIPPTSGVLIASGPVISLTTMTDTYGYGQVYDVANFLPDGSIIRPKAYVISPRYPVTVAYIGGRAIVPALIRQAALDYIKWCWDSSQRGPTTLPVEEFAPNPQTVPLKIRQALRSYAHLSGVA